MDEDEGKKGGNLVLFRTLTDLVRKYSSNQYTMENVWGVMQHEVLSKWNLI